MKAIDLKRKGNGFNRKLFAWNSQKIIKNLTS